MGMTLALLWLALPIHGLLYIAGLRNRQMNQYILNDALGVLRRAGIGRRL
jgi:hypothetical protein